MRPREPRQRRRLRRRTYWEDYARDASLDPQQRARLQVLEIRRFYHHAFTYVMTNTGLALVNWLVTPGAVWFIFPLFFWGMGLLRHAFRTFGNTLWLGREWEEKKIAQILAKDKIKTLSSEKQLARAQLRLLQAQIEPHFLFNTLANVLSLIDVNPGKAKEMLERFIAYLRSSLAISRQEQSTLAREEEMLRNYLTLLQIRMAERLTYSIQVDPELSAHPFPPMLLQPLVENAIKHGLEPKIEGGFVSIRVWREGDRMKVDVHDDGLGFAAKTSMQDGSGVGLSNLRERLAVLYDDEASLTIEDAQPGTRVHLNLPYQRQAS